MGSSGGSKVILLLVSNLGSNNENQSVETGELDVETYKQLDKDLGLVGE